ncbi:MAG: hypothetical protein A2Y33_04075 [Spirochaetes bacterium GWF1_51_8]|nr:MAG: hypothetical protein A2Y33_04075 [Spirochaetes bacterium GWF1_51_8]
MDSFTFDETRNLAKSDFERARNRAFFGRLFSTIFHVNNQLFQFDEVKYMLSPNGMVYRGMKSIPLEHIVGSEGRYQDFDINFLPRQTHTRDRWEGIDIARIENKDLPPISVYQIGENYFVRDGNHRVSVARERGQAFIDAEVTELFTRMPLTEKQFTDKGLLIAESYGFFLERTHLDEIVPSARILLSAPWGYYRMLEHISTYKYLLGEKEHRDPSWEEAVRRWYYDVYLVLVKVIAKARVMKRFPERTKGDLYLWIMDHWHFLKEKYGETALEHAVRDFSEKFGQHPVGIFFTKIKEKIVDLLTGRKRK